MVGLAIRSNDEFEAEVYERFRTYSLNDDKRRFGDPEIEKSKAVIDILDRSLNPTPANARLLTVTKGFWGVEKLLPDYMGHILELIRDSAGRIFFHGQWVGEESKHGLWLEEWMRRVDEIDTLWIINQFKGIAATSWDPVKHFDTPKQPNGLSWFLNALYGNGYVTIQEKATANGYTGKRRFAQRCGQEGLAEIDIKLATDEARHHGFFLEISRLMMRYRPVEYSQIIRLVYDRFEMPGKYVLNPAEPGAYAEWSQIAAEEGVIPMEPTLQRRQAQREERAGLLDTDQRSVLRNVRAKCWNQHINSMRQIFKELEVELPASLAHAQLVPISA
jgi:hypothetical protein